MKLYFLPLLFLFVFNLSAQEISETNTDLILVQANEAFQASDYKRSLQLTARGLELAPDYHDIRILQARNHMALNNLNAADGDLDLLIEKVPQYEGLRALLLQRINRFDDKSNALAYIDRLDKVYPGDIVFEVKRSQLLLDIGQYRKSRILATELIKKNDLEPGHTYLLHTILRQTVTDEVGVNYQYIGFSDEYTNNDPWHSISGEYQHNFGRTATLARITYSDRGFRDGMIYELEAYPVFNQKFYSFVNLGFSNGEMFPDFRGSLSVFYNFAKSFEGELGGRVQKYQDDSFYTGILGLTFYHGKFYFNARTFLGPETNGHLVQNYQGNVRYYLSGPENYLYLRIGNGISPDERILSTQVLENPLLEVYYGTLGVNFSIGINHLFQVGAGFLSEDLPANNTGTQIIGSVGYRYRF